MSFQQTFSTACALLNYIQILLDLTVALLQQRFGESVCSHLLCLAVLNINNTLLLIIPQ